MSLVLSQFPGIGLLDSAFEAEGFCVVRGPDVLWGGDIRRFHPPAGKFDGVIGGPPCQCFSLLAHLVRANGHEPKFGNLIPEFERCVLEAEPDWFLMEEVPQAPEPVVAGYGVKSFLLDNSALAGQNGFGLEQRRVRRFSFGTRGREAPNLLRWIDLATFLLPDAERTLTNYPVDNSQEAKGRTRRQAVLSDPSAVPVKIGGSGKLKRTVIGGGTLTPGAELARNGQRTRDAARNSRVQRFSDACRLQGLPEDFLKDAPFTAEGKLKAVANGVPIQMGRAIARAIKEALR